MLTEKDILTAIQQGQSPEEIANKFSNMLNAAVAQYEKDNQRNEKIKACEKMLNDLAAYITKFYPNESKDLVTEKVMKGLSAADLVDTWDKIIKETHSMYTMMNKVVKKTDTNADDVLRKFLKINGF